MDDDGGGGGGGAGAAGAPRVLLLAGEAFFESSEAEATDVCERRAEAVQSRLDRLEGERAVLARQQDQLKRELYARFGASINLEDEPTPPPPRTDGDEGRTRQ